jgi:phasin family protein
MSSFDLEQFLSAQRTTFDRAFGLAGKAFEGFERIIELNLQTVKTTLAENEELVAKAVAAKDPQSLFAVPTTQMPAAMEKLQAYWRHVYEIVSGTQAEFVAAAEARVKQSQHDAEALIDSVAKNAPTGSEAVVSAWKSAIGVASESASAAYDAAKKAAKDVILAAESNVNAASSAAKDAAAELVANGKASSAKK